MTEGSLERSTARPSAELIRGIRAAVPILIGYFPTAMAFGLIARTMSLRLMDACSMSLIVFAGASQFMALGLWSSGVAVGQIVIATLLMNFRHFLMSASLSRRIAPGARLLPLIAFGITDETFAIASARRGELRSGYLIGLESVAYLSWASGTAVGYTLGRVLPDVLQRSLGISLYALFIAILVPAVRRSWRAALIAAGAGLCHLALSRTGLLSPGWNIIVAILVGAGAGALLFPEGHSPAPAETQAQASRQPPRTQSDTQTDESDERGST